MRIGPCMSAVASFVSRNPGLAMMHAAAVVGPNGSLKYGYDSVHRALRAGLVRGVRGPRGATLLYPIEVAQVIALQTVSVLVTEAA